MKTLREAGRRCDRGFVYKPGRCSDRLTVGGFRCVTKIIGSLEVVVIRYTDYADLTDLHGFFY